MSHLRSWNNVAAASWSVSSVIVVGVLWTWGGTGVQAGGLISGLRRITCLEPFDHFFCSLFYYHPYFIVNCLFVFFFFPFFLIVFLISAFIVLSLIFWSFCIFSFPSLMCQSEYFVDLHVYPSLCYFWVAECFVELDDVESFGWRTMLEPSEVDCLGLADKTLHEKNNTEKTDVGC